MVGQTNHMGLLRVYAMIDVMPYGNDGTFAPVQIVAQAGWASGNFNIEPGLE